MHSYMAKDKNSILFVLIGLPGSGKSHYAKELIVERDGGKTAPVVFSSDELRKELFGTYNVQNKNTELFNELHRRIREALKAGKDVVYDATNIYKNKRTGFLRSIDRINCHKVAVVFAKDVKSCQDMNRQREKAVPDDVITRMWMNWSPPDYSEGFDEIEFITPTVISVHYDLNILMAFLDNIGQKNHHHTLTIGEHCRKAALVADEVCSGNNVLKMSALLHDIGKLYTATFIKPDGTVDNECHYYHHENVGAYEAMLYLSTHKYVESIQDKVMILNLIYHHMMPYSWHKNPELKDKCCNKYGVEFVQYLSWLHTCDLKAK